MIITRSPLRISLGGGGTDLPSFYREHGGFLVAMAMSKYVYVTLHRRFDPGFLLKYSRIEQVTGVDEIAHPIIREALRVMGTRDTDLEITSVADVPAGTGLGSSSSFTSALLRGLHVHQRRYIDTAQLAELACHVEIDRMHEPIGKQDQYITAFGGLTAFTFNADNTVNVESLPISEDALADLSDNMLLFFTGSARDASKILRDQDVKSRASDPQMAANLNKVKTLGYLTRDAFVSGRLGDWGEIMLEHWKAKKQRSSAMSSPQIDEWYDLALRNGAIGGKLVGAGGGGFLLFYAHDPRRLRQAMLGAGLRELYVQLDVEGTKVINR